VRRVTRLGLLGPGLLASLALAGAASAHSRSQSFSSWAVDGDEVRAVFSVEALELTRLPELGAADPLAPGSSLEQGWIRRLPAWIALRAAGRPCAQRGEARALAARRGFARAEIRFCCPADARLELAVSAFREVAPSHLHIARVSVDGGPPLEHLFGPGQAAAVIRSGGAAAPGASFLGYLRLGMAHIAAGLDHLAFLAALLAVSASLGEVARVATGFTLGHSLTLSLAAQGALRPDSGAVEAAVGFSIALVAAEHAAAQGRAAAWRIGGVAGAALLGLAGLRLATGIGPAVPLLLGLALLSACYLPLVACPARARRVRPAATALFGLVHGLAFAGALLELGVPAGRRVRALLGFNLGVELGQLAEAGALWTLGMALRQRWPGAWRGSAVDWTCAVLCGLGLLWFVGRAYG
jgi:hypothetical protein